MTIVYTENGSEVINDGLVESIKFDRKEQNVYVIPANAPQEPSRKITNVQQVIYNVQANQTAINDSCEEILELRKWKRFADRMRAFS